MVRRTKAPPIDIDAEFIQPDPDEMIPAKVIEREEEAPIEPDFATRQNDTFDSGVAAMQEVDDLKDGLKEAAQAAIPVEDSFPTTSVEESETVPAGVAYRFPKGWTKERKASPVPSEPIAAEPGRGGGTVDPDPGPDRRYAEAMLRHPAFRWKPCPPPGQRWKLALHPACW